MDNPSDNPSTPSDSKRAASDRPHAAQLTLPSFFPHYHYERPIFFGMAAHKDLPTPGPESPQSERKPYRFATLCATVENPDMKDQYGASSAPIYQSATFKGIAGEYDYSRSGNPTRSHLGEFNRTYRVTVHLLSHI